jgi:hypothetical protein
MKMRLPYKKNQKKLRSLALNQPLLKNKIRKQIILKEAKNII